VSRQNHPAAHTRLRQGAHATWAALCPIARQLACLGARGGRHTHSWGRGEGQPEGGTGARQAAGSDSIQQTGQKMSRGYHRDTAAPDPHLVTVAGLKYRQPKHMLSAVQVKLWVP